jgi:chromosome segregation ATPase
MNEALIAIITALTGTTAWQFWIIRTKLQHKEKGMARSDAHEHRDDLRDRVRTLERLLNQSSEEKDNLREEILILTGKVKKLETTVEWLQKENEALKKRAK